MAQRSDFCEYLPDCTAVLEWSLEQLRDVMGDLTLHLLPHLSNGSVPNEAVVAGIRRNLINEREQTGRIVHTWQRDAGAVIGLVHLAQQQNIFVDKCPDGHLVVARSSELAVCDAKTVAPGLARTACRPIVWPGRCSSSLTGTTPRPSGPADIPHPPVLAHYWDVLKLRNGIADGVSQMVQVLYCGADKDPW